VALLQLQAGRVLSAAGRSAQALTAYQRALALDNTLADAHYELCLLYEDMGEPRLSARHFRAYSRVMQTPVQASEQRAAQQRGQSMIN
jgi:tetratricopeptide (TPR) repeat protein